MLSIPWMYPEKVSYVAFNIIVTQHCWQKDITWWLTGTFFLGCCTLQISNQWYMCVFYWIVFISISIIFIYIKPLLQHNIPYTQIHSYNALNINRDNWQTLEMSFSNKSTGLIKNLSWKKSQILLTKVLDFWKYIVSEVFIWSYFPFRGSNSHMRFVDP